MITQGYVTRGAERPLFLYRGSAAESGRPSKLHCAAGVPPLHQSPVTEAQDGLRCCSTPQQAAQLRMQLPAQVDDCIAKYLWMQTMVQRMAERKKQGLAMPTSMTEVEEQLGENPHTDTMSYLPCPERVLKGCAGNKRTLSAVMSPMQTVPPVVFTCWRVARTD